MVGPCRLELQTSSVSRKRSNQLSYGPEKGGDNSSIACYDSALLPAIPPDRGRTS